MNIQKIGVCTLIGLESLLYPALSKGEEPLKFSLEYVSQGKPFAVEWQKKDEVYNPRQEQEKAETNTKDSLCILAGVGAVLTATGAVSYASADTKKEGEPAAWMMVISGLVTLPTAVGCLIYVSN